MLNFVRFHAIESEIELAQEFFFKKGLAAPYGNLGTYSSVAICTQIASLLFLLIYILHIKFCPISSARNRDQRILKILERVRLQHHLVSYFFQKLLDANLHLDIIKYKISLNSVD